MNFDSETLRKAVEDGFEVGQSTDTSVCVTGKPYVTIGSQIDGIAPESGVVREGALREWAFDEETAYWMALNCFKNYALDNSGKLYWRQTPIFDRDPSRKGHRCMFYMRLVIA